ncbi:hypothetical protein C5Y96_00435 [Blastopirellula marina]|uniref:Uncharacterized protein n=1 Tax=Blastopirellula marina TaxID=124 RepID=A0A2S8G9W0_9BACT|nr:MULTISPECIES: hypothetical protein [Pirellulaceae]PQO41217.1 hypothetical protein C5Y96_00435 [Blastopirellula marina]RCS56241.1 hypothetical protein DTL36_00435 [Bremerella cremea]
MSQSHLQDLYGQLVQRGWKVVEHRRSSETLDVPGAAVWEIRRFDNSPAILLDFPGFDGVGENIDLDESYACGVRGRPIELYFSRVNRSQERWLEDLASFIAALDLIETG